MADVADRFDPSDRLKASAADALSGIESAGAAGDRATDATHAQDCQKEAKAGGAEEEEISLRPRYAFASALLPRPASVDPALAVPSPVAVCDANSGRRAPVRPGRRGDSVKPTHAAARIERPMRSDFGFDSLPITAAAAAARGAPVRTAERGAHASAFFQRTPRCRPIEPAPSVVPALDDRSRVSVWRARDAVDDEPKRPATGGGSHPMTESKTISEAAAGCGEKRQRSDGDNGRDGTAAATVDGAEAGEKAQHAEEHPLQRKWVWWVHRPCYDGGAYESTRLPLSNAVDTVESFWRHQNNLPPPSRLFGLHRERLSRGCQSTIEGISLFEADVLPEWEHVRNAMGATIVFKGAFGPQHADAVWQRALLGLVGEHASEDVAHITGIRLVDRVSSMRLEVWVDDDGKDIVDRVGRWFLAHAIEGAVPPAAVRNYFVSTHAEAKTSKGEGYHATLRHHPHHTASQFSHHAPAATARHTGAGRGGGGCRKPNTRPEIAAALASV